ncbi:MAG: ABC-type branched-subunit amino acid transport system ATPase component/MFS family permease [Glaciecola sp.]|jgi:ABC-type branched-subunit amino acid transport system ATPase component/MFS family permease
MSDIATEDQVLRRRTLVPSARQVVIGEDFEAEVIAGPAGSESPPPEGGRMRRILADADPRRVVGPKFPLIVLALSGTIATWDDAALAILAPDIRAEFGFSVAFLVFLSTLMGYVTKFASLPFGVMADKVKRVWMVRVGSIVANLASVGQGLAPGVGALVGSRMVGGLGAAAVQPASFPLLADYYEPKARTRVFSFLAIGGNVGAIVGPLVVGFIAARYGWRPAVVALGVLASVVSLLTFFLREPARGRSERVDAGMDEAAAAEAEQPSPSFAEAYRTMSSITTLRRFWYAAPFTIMAGVGAGPVLAVYYSEVFVLGPAQRGMIVAVGAGIGIIALLLFGSVGDRMLATRPATLVLVAAGATVYQALSYVALAFAPNVTFAVAVGIPATVVSTVLFPAQITMISMIVPPRMRGIGMQTSTPWELLGLAAAPLITTLAINTLGLKMGLIFFGLPLLPAAAVVASTASYVERDIRNARQDAMAEAEAKRIKVAGEGQLVLVRNLDVGYDGVQVLFGVDLDVEEGELLALLGTNGAGKSTLLRAIAGTQDPTSGAIFLDGRDITHAPAYQTAEYGVVMMPGGRAVFADLTVHENLEAANWLYRELGDVEWQARLAQVLDFFPVLRDRMDQVAGNLSGGEQQMVALGQAFIMRPRLLMIDELSLGLAPQIVEQLLEILRQIHAAGTTIVIVEQSLNVAMTIAQRAVFMDKGQIRFDGPTEELLARPDLVRSVFIGGGAGRTRTKAAVAAPETRVPILEARDIAVSYGGIQALRSASLTVHPGEIVGIIGPNGAGKTTLFDVLSGFVTPDHGEVWLEGEQVTGLAPDVRGRRGLGRSFQNARLFPSLTVRETIAVFMERRAVRSPFAGALWLPNVRRAEEQIDGRVDGLIELLGLEAFAEKFVGELSTGSRRVVDVACVMAQHPKVLLLDEPTSGLAQAESEALGPLMLRIVRELGCGLVLIEHDVPLVSSVSDRMIAMEFGANIVTGTPDEVTKHPEVMRAYLEASEAVVSRSGTRSDMISQALHQDAGTTPSAERGTEPNHEVNRG